MNVIKNCYYYFFYKLYNWYESFPLKWWSDWKAAFSITILEILMLVTLEGILSALNERDLIPINTNIFAISIGIIIFWLNYFVFIYKDKWKPYVDRFEMWPKNKNKLGGIIVWIIIGIVFISLILMYYMLSKVNWNT